MDFVSQGNWKGYPHGKFHDQYHDQISHKVQDVESQMKEDDGSDNGSFDGETMDTGNNVRYLRDRLNVLDKYPWHAKEY